MGSPEPEGTEKDIHNRLASQYVFCSHLAFSPSPSFLLSLFLLFCYLITSYTDPFYKGKPLLTSAPRVYSLKTHQHFQFRPGHHRNRPVKPLCPPTIARFPLPKTQAQTRGSRARILHPALRPALRRVLPESILHLVLRAQRLLPAPVWRPRMARIRAIGRPRRLRCTCQSRSSTRGTWRG